MTDSIGNVLLEWHHTSSVVSHLDEALEFRRRTLGLEVVFVEYGMSTQIQSMLGQGGITCDLAQTRLPVSGHVQEFIAFHDVPPGLDPRLPVRVGQGHVAYVVADLEASVRTLVAQGAEQIGNITDFAEGPAVYCWAPTGEVIELEQRWLSRR